MIFLLAGHVACSCARWGRGGAHVMHGRSCMTIGRRGGASNSDRFSLFSNTWAWFLMCWSTEERYYCHDITLKSLGLEPGWRGATGDMQVLSPTSCADGDVPDTAAETKTVSLSLRGLFPSPPNRRVRPSVRSEQPLLRTRGLVASHVVHGKAPKRQIHSTPIAFSVSGYTRN